MAIFVQVCITRIGMRRIALKPGRRIPALPSVGLTKPAIDAVPAGAAHSAMIFPEALPIPTGIFGRMD
jgi:hypothetical protein